MILEPDLDRLLTIVRSVDPSFRDVGPDKIERHLIDLRSRVDRNDTEGFLLSAMALLAVPGNGHTRLIPNRAVRVLPLRFVALGSTFRLLDGAEDARDCLGARLVRINGVDFARIEEASLRYLAGTRQRQRVIGGIPFVWPRALARLGVAPTGGGFEYEFETATGRCVSVRLDEDACVPATALYPRNEHGQPSADWMPGALGEVRDWAGKGVSIRLPSFLDPGDGALISAMSRAARDISMRRDCKLLIDVRGNTGGDFLKTLPLIQEITENWNGRVCAVLVDKFTFSAAIVFVAILKYHLGNRMVVLGEEMGDALRFFAEGGLMDLPGCGAKVRYSTALHDWEDGVADGTTPEDIARHLVPVRKLDIDLHHVASLAELRQPTRVYPTLFDRL